LSFEDVPTGSTFYTYIECLACRGIINGYPCGGPLEPCNANNDPYFRPSNNVTRGQFAKMASNAAGFTDPAGGLQYTDVPIGSTYYDYIWRLTNRGYVTGYPCGGPGEPCDGGNRPYFRPNANVTRGQLSKIDANTAGYNDTPSGQQYQDVQIGSTFYDFIYRLSIRGIIAGYPCGGVSEPCQPGNLPYFRPNANATRGQASKIVANTFFPECSALQAPALKQSVNQ
jgi:S-layer homology domain